MSLHTADFASCVSGELADTGPLVPPSESKSMRGKKKEVKKRTLQKSDIPSGSRSSAMKPKSMIPATVSRPPDEANVDENVEVSAMELRMNKMEAMLARVVAAIPGPAQTQSGNFSDESADLEDVESDHEGEHYTCVPNIAAKFAVPTGLGEPVDEEIANSASYLIMNRLEDKVLADTSAKYLPPSNCEYLDTPKVNSAIWDNLTQRSRTRDLKLQRVQRSLTRGLSAFTQSLSSQTITETQQDSLALICNANFELNSLRKEFIKPEMNEAYSHLCKPSAPVTKYLFGDDLGKRMKDLKEEQRAAAGAVKQDKPAYRSHQRYHPYKPQNFSKFQDAGWTSSAGPSKQSFQKPSYQRSSSFRQPFLGQGRGRGKPPAQQNQQQHSRQGQRK
ncbi:uncharacterized protein LOC100892194 [Strongylocentrotus purpuratus]|uniref:Uncharacterized protein n=1 Tax=Strongylocentrotus purpuratus TaxID=7668 RepID=A0A7M7NXD7_STRPU|nr:uncharacterized protein LOC100892194 [Strongylocentrotus purpuratus]